jgi:polygalacturonase
LGFAGDDCISIQDGCSDVFIRSVHCGPGHGISIGGLGKGGASAAVSDVTVQDVTLKQTMTGVRIKTWQVNETAIASAAKPQCPRGLTTN